jgi:hypothetical protein
MRQILSRSLLTVAAVGGVLAATGGAAHADSSATSDTSGSPGILSGNNVQVPVHVPVNVCGDTVDAVGALNPAFGSNCANVSVAAPPTRPAPTPVASTPSTPNRPAPQAPPAPSHTQLAETGLSAHTAGAATGAGAALLLGGALLYRRGSRTRTR